MTSTHPFAEVIGDPIEYSKSPVIHRFWLERLGIPAEYRATRIGREELQGYLAARKRDPKWRGCNVTMPLKLDALMQADERADGAIQVGATNCLVIREGELVALNTDVAGVAAVVIRLARLRPTATVTVLGSGGAARAVLVALKTLGTNNVAIQARNLSEAQSLAQQFQLALPPRPFDAPVRTDGLINATPLGMSGSPPLTVDLGEMPRGGWVFDLVTSPNPTALVVEAERSGLAASGGLPMLVEQAAAAFPLFFGAEPPRDTASDGELYQRLGS
ncbi:shikimate dehydrogenase family protein [Sphingomonas arenae]|uniref:shikimate dehydrogenase family protein n=1 Tax=Sphingomonas arenae TaxID=2812555 RepID=UPI0019678406|nr:shikimate dehydrogenase [Sphingomonas arenae]